MHELLKRLHAFVEKVGCSPFKSEDYYDPEWVRTFTEWDELREAAKPWPKCCAEMREHRGLIYAYFFDDGFYEAPESPEKYENHRMAWRLAYQAPGGGTEVASPERCPFCGQVLPKIRPKAKRPAPICQVEDGGYYCSGCSERLDSCLCWYPHSAYEIVEES